MNVSSLRQNLIRSKYFDSDLGTQDPVLTQPQILFGRKYFVNKVSNFGDGRIRRRRGCVHEGRGRQGVLHHFRRVSNHEQTIVDFSQL